MFKKILVPVDGSEPSWQALSYAAEIGKKFNSDLVIVHVIQPFYNASFMALPVDSNLWARQMDDLQSNAETVLMTAVEKVGSFAGNIEKEVETGHPSERIIALIEKTGADAVVIGSRGLSGITEFVLGSVSSNVSQYAKVPVLIIKSDSEEEEK